MKIGLTIRHVQDVRNYKVSIEKAKNVLSFHPRYDVQSIVGELIKHGKEFSDWDNPIYYNIQMFRTLENGVTTPAMPMAAGVHA